MPNQGSAPLGGRHGSGTIFLSHCGLRCCFCQNHEISFARADALNHGEIALPMLRLQGQGCHNINLVTPTHSLPQILAAVAVAAGRGLEAPLVWNRGGYEDAGRSPCSAASSTSACRT